MTTRRDLLKGAVVAAVAGVMPALPAGASNDTGKHIDGVIDGKQWLSGHITLYDPEARAIIWSDIAFVTDGLTRAEIIITNPDSEEEHRLVFTGATNWQPVSVLIDVMKEIGRTVEVLPV